MSSSVNVESDSEEASSSSDIQKDPEQELDAFRNNWKKELKVDEGRRSSQTKPEDVESVQNALNDLTLDTDSVEETAKKYFLQGVELEKKGKVFEAIRLYRRSIQLVPDIEFKIYEITKQSMRAEEAEKAASAEAQLDECPTSYEEEEDLSEVDMMARFQNAILRNGFICQKTSGDKVISTGGAGHFSNLPLEIIIYIFRWVLSNNQLDVRSLDACSLVCKGFYLCARAPEIWRAVCIKVWGVNVGTLEDSAYLSWREMFYKRHRVLFSGVYIAKTTYLRMGENSFQDQFYRPIHLVEYYRLMRFFPDGSLLMTTSADDLQASVAKLRSKQNLPNDAAILQGHFRLLNDKVIIALKPQSRTPQYRRRKASAAIDEAGATARTFYIEMKIESTAKRKFCKLEWSLYSVLSVKGKTEVSTEFDLKPALFPALYFSRVKSYHLETDAALS